MRQIAALVFIGVLMLTACVPTTDSSAQFDVRLIRSIATLRDGDDVTITWGISEGASDYDTWIELYNESEAAFVASMKERVSEATVVSGGEHLFSARFLLSEVANRSKDGETEFYTLLIRVAVQVGESNPVHSGISSVTFYSTTREGAGK